VVFSDCVIVFPLLDSSEIPVITPIEITWHDLSFFSFTVFKFGEVRMQDTQSGDMLRFEVTQAFFLGIGFCPHMDV
jgi:hypothetical protein